LLFKPKLPLPVLIQFLLFLLWKEGGKEEEGKGWVMRKRRRKKKKVCKGVVRKK
jgi:hypothetical protein